MSAILECYFPFDFDNITVIGVLFCISLPNCIEIGYPRLSIDVLLLFKTAVAAAQYCFRFRIG